MRFIAAIVALLLSTGIASATSGVPNHHPKAAFNGQGWLPDCWGYAPTTGTLTACPPGVRFRNHQDLVFTPPGASGGTYNPVYVAGSQAYNTVGMDSTQFGSQIQVGGVWYTIPWSADPPISVSCGASTNIMILEYSGPTPYKQTDLGPGVNPIIQCQGSTWKDHLVYWANMVPGGANGQPYAIYYSGVNGSGATGLATASSITGPWTDYGSNPILSGFYETTPTAGPGTSRYLFTHAAGTGSGKVYSIGSNGITLTSVGITLTAPTSNDWDHASAAQSDFMQEMSVRYNRHGFWEMWYMAYDGGAQYNQSIGYAVAPSPTGPWLRKPTGPTVWFATRQFTSGSMGGTTAVAPGCPTVVESAGLFMLEFCSGSTFAPGNGWIDFMVDY